jgi:hypothetical protein
MGFTKASGTFSDAERRIIELLLSGENPVFPALRRQLSPPFLISVERTTNPKRLTITVTFDGNLEREYSVGEGVNVQIDDVLVIDKRIPQPVICKAVIHLGILGAMREARARALAEGSRRR